MRSSRFEPSYLTKKKIALALLYTKCSESNKISKCIGWKVKDVVVIMAENEICNMLEHGFLEQNFFFFFVKRIKSGCPLTLL